MRERKTYDIATYINGVFTVIGEANTEFDVDGKGTDGIGGNTTSDLKANQVFFLVERAC